ncbi:MAG: tryptophan-rich sensory protein [Candidatus Omnitrophica bacterium]|nr:tryptophan-rich sensory protein [Candidatus Omnitrophota bacterium]
MKYIKFLKFVISISVCFMAGIIGSFFTSSSVNTWYKTLNKPVFNPPDWLFAPVWTFLYIIMGLSLSIVWNSEDTLHKKKRYTGLTFFSIQLFLNMLWSAFFFGLKNPLMAFIEIIFLWVSIIITFLSFKKISVFAGYLLFPYLLWVSFAGFLNYAIYVMN